MNQDDFNEIVHAYLDLMGMFERAREALSGKVIPDNPDKLERYRETKKGIDSRPQENHIRNLEALRALGLRQSEGTETLLRVMDVYHRLRHSQFDCTEDQNQVIVPFLEEMEKVAHAQNVIASASEIPNFNKRNLEALKVLGLKSNKKVKKAETEFQNMLSFIQYLKLTGIHRPNVAAPGPNKPRLTKTEAVKKLAEIYHKSPQAIIQQIKRGRKTMIDRSGQDLAWLVGALPPDWPST
jgi:hypothetical protein